MISNGPTMCAHGRRFPEMCPWCNGINGLSVYSTTAGTDMTCTVTSTDAGTTVYYYASPASRRSRLEREIDELIATLTHAALVARLGTRRALRDVAARRREPPREHLRARPAQTYRVALHARRCASRALGAS